MSYRDTLAEMARANSAEAQLRDANRRLADVTALHVAQLVVQDGYPDGALRCAACGEMHPCRTRRAAQR